MCLYFNVKEDLIYTYRHKLVIQVKVSLKWISMTSLENYLQILTRWIKKKKTERKKILLTVLIQAIHLSCKKPVLYFHATSMRVHFSLWYHGTDSMHKASFDQLSVLSSDKCAKFSTFINRKLNMVTTVTAVINVLMELIPSTVSLRIKSNFSWCELCSFLPEQFVLVGFFFQNTCTLQMFDFTILTFLPLQFSPCKKFCPMDM